MVAQSQGVQFAAAVVGVHMTQLSDLLLASFLFSEVGWGLEKSPVAGQGLDSSLVLLRVFGHSRRTAEMKHSYMPIELFPAVLLEGVGLCRSSPPHQGHWVH